MNGYSGRIPISKIRLFQIGWNYSQDGPGNRLIFHFQGCNFDCPWCSNPEGRSAQGELFVRNEHLTPEACPHNAISENGLQRDICRSCREKECLHINRNLGIRYTAQVYDIEELVKMAVESRPLFFDGGGVTISGGEATLQYEALKVLVEALKKEGIHTALETNGSHKTLKELFPLIDLLIFDLKHWDFETAETVLKNNGRHVINNLKTTGDAEIDVLIRVTVIPGFNSDISDMKQFASLFSSLPNVEKIQFELLYYHTFGQSKWDSIGQLYKGPEKRITDSDKAEYEKIFESYNLNLIAT